MMGCLMSRIAIWQGNHRYFVCRGKRGLLPVVPIFVATWKNVPNCSHRPQLVLAMPLQPHPRSFLLSDGYQFYIDAVLSFQATQR